MANKLKIQCATCDARKINADNYAGYEQIELTCAVMLTSPAAQAAMARLPIALNCANVLDLEPDVDLRTITGSGEIRSEDAVPSGKFYLQVTGQLTIGPGTQKQLAQCTGMQITGTLICPESLYPTLRGVKVTGSTVCYPDDAVVLKRNAVIDRLFTLRAKDRLYWSPKRMILTDPALDPAALRDKGVRLSAPEVIVAASLVEGLVDCIDEKADLIVVPDGAAVVTDDLTLDRAALRRYGRKLYILGDATVPPEGDVLDELEYLNIRGDARVPQARRDALEAALTEIAGQVKEIKGAELVDKVTVTLTARMLESNPQGLEVRDCGIVKVAPDVTAEQILQRLRIVDCGAVYGSEAQKEALEMVCDDVGEISYAGDPDATGIGQTILSALHSALRSDPDTRVINAAEYVL